MFKINILILLFFTSFAVHAQSFLAGSFRLQLSFDYVPQDAWLEIRYTQGNKIVKDSVTIVGQNALLRGVLDEPSVATVTYINHKNPTNKGAYNNVYSCYLAPGNTEISIKDSMNAATIMSSSHYAKDYRDLLDSVIAFQGHYIGPIYQELSKYRHKDSVVYKNLRKRLDSMYTWQQENIYKKYVLTHPDNPVALHAFGRYAGMILNDSCKQLFETLSPSLKALPTGMKYAEKFKVNDRVGIGQIAPAFTLMDTHGKMVQLADFRGKYVLIDFWASWCVPCRMGNPALVENYNLFKKRNFIIVGISEDKSLKKKNWLDAIAKDGLTWINLLDKDAANENISYKYGIDAIPQNVLLDPQGVIIGKNIFDKELQQKLSILLR